MASKRKTAATDSRPTYTLEFYPAWQRGPADMGTYHQKIAEWTDPFKALDDAKDKAADLLANHNDESPTEKWRVEIWRHVGHRASRSMNGTDHGRGWSPHPQMRIKWTRAGMSGF